MPLSEAQIDTLAGGVGGALGVIVGSPFDVMRVRRQQAARVASAAHEAALRQLWSMLRREGWTAPFRGMATPLATATLQNSIAFNTYGSCLRALTPASLPAAPEQDPSLLPPAAAPSYTAVSVAGMAAGAVQSIVSVPQELVKIRMQVQRARPGDPAFVGTLGTVRDIVRTAGVQGLYQGMGITLLRDVPSFAVYFGVYEMIKSNAQSADSSGGPSPAVALVGGGVAGALAWAAVYPQDVIKSRIQATGAGLSATCREVFNGGLQAVLPGLGLTLTRAFVQNAVIFGGYEAVCYTLRAQAG